MDSKEMANRIYDTRMGNVGMSEYHKQFPADEVENQFIGSSEFWFDLEGETYVVTVKKVRKNWWQR